MNALLKKYESELGFIEMQISELGFTTEQQHTAVNLLRSFISDLKDVEQERAIINTQVLTLLMSATTRIHCLAQTHRKYINNRAEPEYIMMINAQLTEAKRAYRSIFNNLATIVGGDCNEI